MAIRELFQTVFDMKKKEVEMAKKQNSTETPPAGGEGNTSGSPQSFTKVSFQVCSQIVFILQQHIIINTTLANASLGKWWVNSGKELVAALTKN